MTVSQGPKLCCILFYKDVNVGNSSVLDFLTLYLWKDSGGQPLSRIHFRILKWIAQFTFGKNIIEDFRKGSKERNYIYAFEYKVIQEHFLSIVLMII